jgi:MIP family channel proteins
MTDDDFIPSSSVDSHTMPMDAHIPLIKLSPKPAHSINNDTQRTVITNNNTSDVPLTTQMISNNSNQLPQQQIVRHSAKETTLRKLSNKLWIVSQIKTLAFYQALFSEFIGTMLLVLIGISSGLPIASKPIPDLYGSLVFGFVVATIVVGFGHISGAHINPAVTVTFLVSAEIDVIRALCYIGMQSLGSICAAGILQAIAPPQAQGHLGMTMITEGVTISHAIVVEIIITFVLCFTVHAICDKQRDDIGGSKALAVGLAVIVGCLFGGPYTGASMNPARSLGPAAIMNSWQNHWVYWFGPMIGSVLAALIYKFVLQKQPAPVVRNELRSDLNPIKPIHV